MKKVFLSLILITGFVISFSSCKKCYVCDFGTDGTRELCSKDFTDGNEALMLTVNAYEEQGYKCTKK